MTEINTSGSQNHGFRHSCEEWRCYALLVVGLVRTGLVEVFDGCHCIRFVWDVHVFSKYLSFRTGYSQPDGLCLCSMN